MSEAIGPARWIEENRELRAALKPFAEAARLYEEAGHPMFPNGLPDGWTCSVKLGDLRSARTALGPTP